MKTDRNEALLLSHEEIDERYHERLWPESHGDPAGYEALIEKINRIPARERAALMILSRINPLDPAAKLPGWMAAAMKRAAGIPDRTLDWLARRARERLREEMTA